MSPRQHKVPSGITLGHTVATWGGLAAALTGGLSVVRGAWGEAFGCLMLVTAASFFAALWGTE
jgi:hypothetical protein